MAQIFTKETCLPNGIKICNVQLFGTYWDHVWAILGPCFGHFYTIFASRCLKWLKISPNSHACQIKEYSLKFNYQDHIGAIFGHIRAMFGLFVQNICLWMPEIAQIFTQESCMPNRRIPFNVQLLGSYLGLVWAILGPCFGYFYIIFASI